MTAPKPEDAEYDQVIRNFRIALAVSLTAILTGAIFYHIVEKLAWLDSIYFCVITLATVGYGDIVPHTDAGKVFTIFYVLIGIGIIATLANLTLKRALIRRRPK
jgi:voltage-gated potassium channel